MVRRSTAAQNRFASKDQSMTDIFQDSPLRVAGYSFSSRLLVGTGKYQGL